MTERVSRSASISLLISIALTLALWYVIPFGQFIAYPLTLLSTLAHELGHGLAALSVGHSFQSLKLYVDGSGVAYSTGGQGISQAWVAAGGLVGPAIASVGLFAAGKREKSARVALGLLGGALLLIDVLFVRNLFGILFTGTWGLLCLFISIKTPRFSQLTLVFLATQLALSVFSRADYLFTPSAQTSAGVLPSDVAQIAEVLWLPYWFWGGVCALFSIVILILGVVHFLRR